MDLLLHISTADGLRVAEPLAAACDRAGIAWGCFLTGEGVTALGDGGFLAHLTKAQRAVVCEHSWQHHMADRQCPVELGSQTINCQLMAEAARVVSL
jgi:hypothetical protein